jgi:hypothetical protein
MLGEIVPTQVTWRQGAAGEIEKIINTSSSSVIDGATGAVERGMDA